MPSADKIFSACSFNSGSILTYKLAVFDIKVLLSKAIQLLYTIVSTNAIHNTNKNWQTRKVVDLISVISTKLQCSIL